MEEKLNYDPVESSDSEIEQIKVPKISKRKSKVNLIIDTILDDEPVQTPKSRGRPRKQPVKEQDPDKPKRVQSEQQKQNFQKCIAARKHNIELRKQQKAEQAHSILS